MISNQGPAFCPEFKDYCESEKTEHIPITMGIPRGNRQVERLHAKIMPILSKLSINDPNKWYKHAETVQRTIQYRTPNLEDLKSGTNEKLNSKNCI